MKIMDVVYRVEEKVLANSKSDWNPNSTRLKLAKNKTEVDRGITGNC